MPRDVEWRLVVDETGAVKRMELVGKEQEKVDKGFQKTKKSAKEAESSLRGLGSAFGGLRSAMGLAFGAFGAFGIGAGFGLQGVLSTTSSLQEETAKFHAVTGMGIQSSLDYVAALKARGIGTEAVTRGYKALSKSVQTAERQQYGYTVASERAHAKGRLYTGMLGVQAEAFQQLGIDFAAFKALKPEKQFELITEKLEAMPAGLEKTRIAGQLFGRGGTNLLPVLEKGGLSLNHFRHEAERFFPTLRGQGVQTLDELREKVDEGEMAWEGLKFTLGMKLAPALSGATAWFSRLVISIERGHGAWGTLEHDAAMVVGDFKEVVGWFHRSKLATDALEVSLGFLGVAWGTEKVLSFYGAIKKLTLVSALAKGFRSLAFSEAAAGTASLSMAGSLGAVLATLSAIQPLIKKLSGGDLGENPQTDSHASDVFHLGSPVRRRAEGAIALWGLAHPHVLASGHMDQGLSQLSPFNRQWLADQLKRRIGHSEGFYNLKPGEAGSMEQALRRALSVVENRPINVHIHMDGARVAEVQALNPRAMRHLAEGVERSSLTRNSRR